MSKTNIPVSVLNTFGVNANAFDQVAEMVRAAGGGCDIFQWPGWYGDLAPSASEIVDSLRADASARLRQLNQPPSVLVGHNLSALVALGMDCERVVAIEPAGLSSSLPWLATSPIATPLWTTAAFLAPGAIRTRLIGQSYRRWNAINANDQGITQWIERFQAGMHSRGDAARLIRRWALVQRAIRQAAIPKRRSRTLIVLGARSSSTRQLTVRPGDVVVFLQTGRLPHVEAPQRIAELITAFAADAVTTGRVAFHAELSLPSGSAQALVVPGDADETQIVCHPHDHSVDIDLSDRRFTVTIRSIPAR